MSSEGVLDRVHSAEEAMLADLRKLRRAARGPGVAAAPQLTLGQRIADTVASNMGSWPFIIIQSTILSLWIVLNVTAWIEHWDPYPFILLNLALSFQAAYAAPFIMMSQNRQQDRSAGGGDRLSGQHQGGTGDRGAAREDRSAARSRGDGADQGGERFDRIAAQVGDMRARGKGCGGG